MSRETEAIFQLESLDLYPNGMVLFEIEQSNQMRSLAEISPTELSSNPTANSTFLVELNTLIAHLVPSKSYILVTATYNKGL